MENFLMGLVAFLLFKVSFSLRAFTPDNIDYAFPLARKGFTVTNITQLTFKLKACNDANIFLQEDKAVNQYSKSWKFLLGTIKNTKSGILTLPSNMIYSLHHEYVLNCNQFQPFWIRWKGGLLELGKGSEFGTDKICVHQISPLEFNYVFLLTAWGSTGCWDIDTDSVLTSGWKKVPGNKKLQGLKVKSYHASGPLVCGNRCAIPTEDLPCGCVELSYNTLTKQCLVVDESETSTLVTATGWRTWQLM